LAAKCLSELYKIMVNNVTFVTFRGGGDHPARQSRLVATFCVLFSKRKLGKTLCVFRQKRRDS